MNRRAFLAGPVSAVLAAPATAAPPQGKVLRLGLLYGIKTGFDPASNPEDQALVEGLRAHGHELGRNVIFEFRSARSNPPGCLIWLSNWCNSRSMCS
jgi:hypothetical protein